MSTFFEATWFLWWILTVSGVLRWFHNASQFDGYLDSADGQKVPATLALKTRLEVQPKSRAS